MRILHILDHGLPLQSGYTFRTRAILKAQEGLGWTVAAVTGPRHGVAPASVESVDGLTFHRTAAGVKPGPVGEVVGIAAFAKRIEAAVDAFKPDILHAHSPVIDALAALIVARKRKLPLVYEIRAFWEDAAVGNGTGTATSLRYRATRALETWAVRRADAVAVICEGLRGDLIAAMPALVAQRPEARLLMVGGGPMEATLRAQAAASPVADAIRFVGRVPHHEVERYYGLVDILAYPRKRMRLTDLVTPLKPLEAMAQGRLVAASDVGGHRELIRDGDTGTLFPPDDPRAIADALAGMFADRSGWDERRARGRAFVQDERNWSSNILRYEPVYQRLISAAAREN